MSTRGTLARRGTRASVVRFQLIGAAMAAVLLGGCGSTPSPSSGAIVVPSGATASSNGTAASSGPGGTPTASAPPASAIAGTAQAPGSPAVSGAAPSAGDSAPPASGTPAGSSPAPSGFDSPPPPSAVGSPIGAATTGTIGAGGGSLSSADGQVTVTIPGGALAGDTAISIQPIENTAPGGLGLAYGLEPSGVVFGQPVQLSFAYSDADVTGTAPEALGIAFQDDAGRWEWQPTVVLDASAGRISVLTTHFSRWTKVPGWQLRPGAATVRLKGQVKLVVANCLKPDMGGRVYLTVCIDEPDDVTELPPRIQANSWSVNGTAGGTRSVGTVKGDRGTAVYTAPATRPPGPAGRTVVAVSVLYEFLKTRTRLVANITIEAGYHVVGSYLERNSGLICGGAVSPQITDAVAFDLEPTPSGGFAMTHISNSITRFKPPKFPVPVPGASVTLATQAGSAPEVLDATEGSGELLAGPNLLTVLVQGTQRIGSCAFHGNGGSYTAPGSTDDARVSLSFVTTKFAGGTQIGKPDGNGPWAWVVTEQ